MEGTTYGTWHVPMRIQYLDVCEFHERHRAHGDVCARMQGGASHMPGQHRHSCQYSQYVMLLNIGCIGRVVCPRTIYLIVVLFCQVLDVARLRYGLAHAEPHRPMLFRLGPPRSKLARADPMSSKLMVRLLELIIVAA